MSALSDSLYAQARLNPVRTQNRVERVVKNFDGSLTATQVSGNIFTISEDDEEFQAFLVYMVLNDTA